MINSRRHCRTLFNFDHMIQTVDFSAVLSPGMQTSLKNSSSKMAISNAYQKNTALSGLCLSFPANPGLCLGLACGAPLAFRVRSRSKCRAGAREWMAK
jgi:hypothetical protein